MRWGWVVVGVFGWAAVAAARPVTVICDPVESWALNVCQVTRTLAGDRTHCGQDLPLLTARPFPCMAPCPTYVDPDGDRHPGQAECTVDDAGRCQAGCEYDPEVYQ